MKIQTSELSDMALCYSVCMIEMPHLVWGETIGLHHASRQIVVPELGEPDCYSPFTGSKMFVPIIERQGIATRKHSKTGQWYAMAMKDLGGWDSPSWAEFTYKDGKRYGTRSYEVRLRRQRFEGPTLIVAAMRCHVASESGEEVDVPDELFVD